MSARRYFKFAIDAGGQRLTENIARETRTLFEMHGREPSTHMGPTKGMRDASYGFVQLHFD